MQSRALQQACGLSDENVRQGLTLLGKKARVTPSVSIKASYRAQAHRENLTLPLVDFSVYWPDRCWEWSDRLIKDDLICGRIEHMELFLLLTFSLVLEHSHN